MSTRQVTMPKATSSLPAHFPDFLQGIGENVQDFYRLLTRPQRLLKILGMQPLSSYDFAITYAQSRLAKIPAVKDFGYAQRNNTLRIFAYINEPDEQAQNGVYTIYGELLDLLPETDVDLRIVELYGRSKEDMQRLGL